jgi:hypothetical protein
MSFDFIGIPALAINGYLWEIMQKFDNNLEEKYNGVIPFYPIGDSAAGDEPWDQKPYFIYDRVFRFSGAPFYENKRENVLYYLKAREVDSLEWSGILQLILDREDDAAKDVNDWIRKEYRRLIIEEAKKDGIPWEELDSEQKLIVISAYKEGRQIQSETLDTLNIDKKIIENPYPIYFHNVRVYQSRSSSPSSDGKVREFSTVQPYYITEFMIDIHFHFTKTFDQYIKDIEKDGYFQTT